MDANETRTAVVKLIAGEMEAGSVLAPHVAAEIAETIMQGLLMQEYLIANGKIHTVIEASWRDGTDEQESWEVYTHPEPWDEEE